MVSLLKRILTLSISHYYSHKARTSFCLFWVTAVVSSLFLTSFFVPFQSIIYLVARVFFLKMQLITLSLLKFPLSGSISVSTASYGICLCFSFLAFPPSMYFLSVHLKYFLFSMFHTLSHPQTFWTNDSLEFFPLDSSTASHLLPALHPPPVLLCS